jgi:hypothetical protein
MKSIAESRIRRFCPALSSIGRKENHQAEKLGNSVLFYQFSTSESPVFAVFFNSSIITIDAKLSIVDKRQKQ